MNFKLPELSLSKISFLNILITALTFSIVIGFFSIKNTDKYYEYKVKQQEKHYIEKNKKLVKDEVLRVVNRINNLKKILLENQKTSNKKLQKDIQQIIFSELEKDRFGDGDYGYFWIHDLNHIMLLHPNKELIGRNMKNFITHDNQYLFQNIEKLVKEKGHGYISYIWNRPEDINIDDEKTSYVHLIKDWNMIIGSGFYLTELREMLKDEKELIKSSLYENLKENLILIGILIILSILSALFVSKKISKIEASRKEQMNMLKQYKLILDKSAVVSKTDTDGFITYVNSSFSKISGYSKDEIIGKKHNIIRHPESPKSQFRSLWKRIKRGKVWKGLIKNKNKNGNSYFNNTTILPIKNADGDIIEYISAATDVSELIENRTKLKSVFSTDSLTGLGNRVSLIKLISKNKKGVLCLINIDRFKEINDTQGHDTGDNIIKELGDRIFNFLNDDVYTIFRVQADVFAVYTSKENEQEMLNDITDFINIVGIKPYHVNNINIILTYTCGIASGSENIFTYADIALSEAKQKKTRVKTYDASMNNIEKYKQNILWVEKLYKALSDDNIRPFFQPIYNYRTKKVEKYESLMRLIEDDEVVFPGAYLDVAKKTKLYPELTYKIVEKSIDKFSHCEAEFSINLSIEDLMNEELMNFIFDYAIKHNVLNRLVLEIVESEEIEDSDFIAKTIRKFKKQGAKVAIDDFGSGYSNYDYLISLQADYIKIDGSIIKHILEDERTAEVVKSIVNFAQKSNMKTIAEFVSSKEINDKVESLGVDYAQGFYYGKAEPELLSD
ncbi:EAL domain-containing protein [Sulfurimonas lithotrophica]|uniref:EAL domain-containing protein n=1 Tax=Sulfurimonas lithotrophica TaxID=2590022 RepID=A0A5P8P217_9BACT|nr:EAL domain-containing protein [Sulfurimonas lithotrophica]QFR49620.1 EAL domain-containing protein [Sulfurimonas lithotrophica]